MTESVQGAVVLVGIIVFISQPVAVDDVIKAKSFFKPGNSDFALLTLMLISELRSYAELL